MIVAAGVSALQPLMTVALGAGQTESLPPQASAAGIQRTADVAAAATAGNYVGPLIAAVTFVRRLPSPLIYSWTAYLLYPYTFLDSPPLMQLTLTLHPPPLLYRLHSPCSHSHPLWIHQNSISPSLPVPLYRAPQHPV